MSLKHRLLELKLSRADTIKLQGGKIAIFQFDLSELLCLFILLLGGLCEDGVLARQDCIVERLPQLKHLCADGIEHLRFGSLHLKIRLLGSELSLAAALNDFVETEGVRGLSPGIGVRLKKSRHIMQRRINRKLFCPDGQDRVRLIARNQTCSPAGFDLITSGNNGKITLEQEVFCVG